MHSRQRQHQTTPEPTPATTGHCCTSRLTAPPPEGHTSHPSFSNSPAVTLTAQEESEALEQVFRQEQEERAAQDEDYANKIHRDDYLQHWR